MERVDGRLRFTIERSRWLCGAPGSPLLDARGNLTTLGFYGTALGITSMLNVAGDVPTVVARAALGDAWPSWLVRVSSPSVPQRFGGRVASHFDATNALIELVRENDRSDPDAIHGREQRITEIFAAHGVDVEFV